MVTYEHCHVILHDAEFSRDFHSDMHVSDGIECEDGNSIKGDDSFGDDDFVEDSVREGDFGKEDECEAVRPLVGLQNVVGDPLCNTYRRERLEVDEMVVDELNEGHSKPTKYAVRCKDKSCPFRISGRISLAHVVVKRFVPEHTCSGTMRGNDHPLVTAAWAADTCLGLFPCPGDVRPTLIRAYIKDKWGITISYVKAFNAKVIIHEKMCGNAEASYRILPAYAEEMERCNPGTIMCVYRNRQLWTAGDNTFCRLFWSFGPSIRAFCRTIRPLILIDGTHLRGKYKGILLAATAVDGDGGLFSLAYAVVENEMYESWLWFLRLLRQRVIPAEKNNNEFTISSDRMKGLPRAIDEALPRSYHSYCIRHVNANFLKTFKSQILCKLFSRAAYALRERDYKETIECIKAKNAKAEKWISEIPKEKWANIYFKGSRWNMLTTNAAESFNNVLKGARELPIAALVDHTRWKVQEYFYLRRKAASEWKTHLTHNAEKWLARSCLYGSKFTPRPCSWNEYEVISSTNTDRVDLEQRTCTCGLFQIMGLPCGHAIAAMGVNKLDKYRYCQDWFLASTYRTTYDDVIHPTLDRTQWPEPSHVLEVVLPPRLTVTVVKLIINVSLVLAISLVFTHYRKVHRNEVILPSVDEQSVHTITRKSEPSVGLPNDESGSAISLLSRPKSGSWFGIPTRIAEPTSGLPTELK
ncbi:uncharacterized protein LOC143891337 [Tasmannia lanceolata]|uniref:uncharacterized protein LOC143891337 n=1 Tax=Tasmannia lanceolata TaxID=3420 RepID=UPI00406376F0